MTDASWCVLTENSSVAASTGVPTVRQMGHRFFTSVQRAKHDLQKEWPQGVVTGSYSSRMHSTHSLSSHISRRLRICVCAWGLKLTEYSIYRNYKLRNKTADAVGGKRVFCHHQRWDEKQTVCVYCTSKQTTTCTLLCVCHTCSNTKTKSHFMKQLHHTQK